MRILFLVILISGLFLQCNSKKREPIENIDCFSIIDHSNQKEFGLKEYIGNNNLASFLGNDTLKISNQTIANDSTNQWNTFINNDLELAYSDSLIEIAKFNTNRYSLSGMDLNIGDSIKSVEKIYTLEFINNQYRIDTNNFRDSICGHQIYLTFRQDTLKYYTIYMQ